MSRYTRLSDFCQGKAGAPTAMGAQLLPSAAERFSCHKHTCSILRQDEGWAHSEAGLGIGGISSCCGTDYRKLQKGCGGVTLALLPTASAEGERDWLLEGCTVNLSYASTARHTDRLPQLPPLRRGDIGTAPKKGTVPFSSSRCSHHPCTAASPSPASVTVSGLSVTSECRWGQQQSHAAPFSASPQCHGQRV